ncbi:MAG: hypothetical protein EOO10_25080, partial [Chitinophagaceae bacterium]
MRKISLQTLFLGCVLILGCTAQKRSMVPKEELLQQIEQNFRDGSAQYRQMMTRLPADRLPKTYYEKTDKFQTAPSSDWCSGFYPGTVLYLYEQTKEPSLLNEAERILKVLEKEKNNRSMHDLGFMMY